MFRCIFFGVELQEHSLTSAALRGFEVSLSDRLSETNVLRLLVVSAHHDIFALGSTVLDVGFTHAGQIRLI